ncbi:MULTISPECIES: beta-galactosidase [unclassified Sphingomonas]|uniref:beta-galactosidase n=1 Tax=unclassified Sphingomonas TaxID=196159 RepID=UPI000829F4BD|nr:MULTISPECIES: beta-galactosidase [unclassified Sphingomonas]
MKHSVLGVCYYPEHWPESWWADDARRMKGLGLTYVRIGEFAWSRFEPDPGRYSFDWFDRAIDTLAAAGLHVVLCTPTATPPKWLIDRHPDILPVDPDTGRTRGFGSRRHYDFSSATYRREAMRITRALAARYGRNDAVAGWQTDNEISCHDTTLSASPVARDAFRQWCAERYGTIDALNTAWGNVFWSMEYRSFDEIEVPFGAVTETSPAHRMAFKRFASDQVVAFHDEMVAILREHSPGRFITHNFIPMDETGVDNHALARPLDFASYDNYPLGRTDLTMRRAAAEEFRPFMRTGHPDFGAFYFDQTRCLTGTSFWVMEQQPGPVNWAGHNPRPAPGMVRLWSWEAFAHGADVVSYFRWRQVPFAQEQMHAGLLRPDSSEAEAWPEVERVAAELARTGIAQAAAARAPVALMVDIDAQWLAEVERQGDSYDYTGVLLEWYQALRTLGLDVDFVAPHADLSGYRLIAAPCLAMPDAEVVGRMRASGATLVFGPRSGAKTRDVTIVTGLPPGELRELVPVRMLATETIRPDCPGELHFAGRSYASDRWRETIDPGNAEVVATYEDGAPALVRAGSAHYLATLTDAAFLTDFFASLCADAGIATMRLATTLRLRRRGTVTFAFNYGADPVACPAPADAEFLIGGPQIGPRDLAAWRIPE